tara:strand:- start:10981 stop:12189 length:1209 start_codon:yes stop_codon:yes gene_type:complete
MAYFQHAYNKAFVVTKMHGGMNQPTGVLTPGEFAIVDEATYLTKKTSIVAANTIPDKFMGVIGNYNSVDTLDGRTAGAAGSYTAHGGYAESIKTKGINIKYVRDMWATPCITASNEPIVITIPDDCLKCDGSTADVNQLRLDIKGEETLRFLNRFSYATFNYRECCPAGVVKLTGLVVATAWADAINMDPLMKNFVTAVAAPGAAGFGKITLTLSYTPTFFDNCSFDTRDYVGTAPLSLIVSAVNDGGDPCTDTCLTASAGGKGVTNFGLNTANTTATKAETNGSTVADQVILEGRYRQDGGWNQGNKDSARLREILQGDKILGCASSLIDRTAFYAGYSILHSVPRFNNPTGVFDNDQYLYTYYLNCKNAVGALNPDLATMTGIWDSIAVKTGLTVGDYIV